MDPQPIKDASLFLLRKVLHNWSDKTALKILRNLRQAALPSTKLLVVDHVVPHACPDPINNDTIPATSLETAPYPLLANMGQASALAYITDIQVCKQSRQNRDCLMGQSQQMLVALNGQERTLGCFVELLRKSGWRLMHIYGPERFAMKQLLAIPMFV